MTADQLEKTLTEDIPDGTYGGQARIRGWTRAEQDRHYADLCDYLGIVNDRLPHRTN
jgi:hypothetical protein